ncbi:MAG: cytochrome c oxidase subunit 3 family protein [Proteobacteria bacterium]|nr:cytochrome c oxidase subunit 3 family protein [Pseudomonadota bacterium]
MSEHAHGDQKGSRFIQHHYDDAQHQFDSGKLAIWLFLAQEVLFFSALFVAYIIFRTQHPEIFEYGSQYLDRTMGAVNTLVLIGSSFTAAYAVRCAQLRNQRTLVICLAITLACALGFLTIKYFEYSEKIHHGTLYGKKFVPHVDPDGATFPEDAVIKPCIHGSEGNLGADPSIPPPAEGEAAPCPDNTNMFFTLYFAMTGLHGLHVLFGVFVFIWLLVRAMKGHFTPDYYGPVDYAALYWHLVDLIWIFLFPLYYLI